MIINHNVPAINTYRNLTVNNMSTSKSLEKLSSGLRINRAADDAAGLAIDTNVILPDGTRFEGLEGLRSYLMTVRRDDLLRQFCRKLLGYALGRSVQLSDKPLMDSMMKSDLRTGTLVDLIVRSPQFREVRGRDNVANRSPY